MAYYSTATNMEIPDALGSVDLFFAKARALSAKLTAQPQLSGQPTSFSPTVSVLSPEVKAELAANARQAEQAAAAAAAGNATGAAVQAAAAYQALVAAAAADTAADKAATLAQEAAQAKAIELALTAQPAGSGRNKVLWIAAAGAAVLVISGVYLATRKKAA